LFWRKRKREKKGSSFFTESEKKRLDPKNIPKHVAIIPDGNRRWARRHCVLPQKGHQKGAASIVQTAKACKELNVQVLSFYLFSTENWKRPQHEIDALMDLLRKNLIEKEEEMIEGGLRFYTIGDLTPLPDDVLKLIEKVQSSTSHCSDIEMIYALNYGGRNEICRAVQAMIKEEETLDSLAVTEELLGKFMDTHPFPDPELLIRTSGEERISNFLLWKIAYTELYFSPLLWPDFTPLHLLEAIEAFQKRSRRLGGE